jgi:cell filamentation protein
MVLNNKLNISSQVELNRMEERLSKQKAKQLFESGDIDHMEVGTFAGGSATVAPVTNNFQTGGFVI